MPQWTDDWHDTMVELGYNFCRPCDEYHRGDECWIDENGVSRYDQPIEEEAEEIHDYDLVHVPLPGRPRKVT